MMANRNTTGTGSHDMRRASLTAESRRAMSAGMRRDQGVEGLMGPDSAIEDWLDQLWLPEAGLPTGGRPMSRAGSRRSSAEWRYMLVRLAASSCALCVWSSLVRCDYLPAGLRPCGRQKFQRAVKG